MITCGYLSFVICAVLFTSVATVKELLGSEYQLFHQQELQSTTNNKKRELSGDPEVLMTVAEIIAYHRYPVEEHTITTADGYKITVQRIPHGKKKYRGSKKRDPVILQHGLLATSSGWVVNIPEKNLPYRLADAGYDVWLGNVRGNSYGKQHEYLTTWNSNFWKFSFHEMGLYDMPAMIDYILMKTGSKQVNYIGYSMGTTILLVTLSSRPEYNDKIRLAEFFGTFASNNYACSPMYYLNPLLRDFEKMLHVFEDLEFLPFCFQVVRLVSSLLSQKCRYQEDKSQCMIGLYLAFGLGNTSNINATRLPVYNSHYPDHSSFRTVLHILQLGTNPFQMYDFGINKNFRIYGQPHPPQYNLSRVTAPIVMYWSEGDPVISPLDITRLEQQLPSIVLTYKIPAEAFNHADYMHHLHADRLYHAKILETLDDPSLVRKTTHFNGHGYSRHNTSCPNCVDVG